MHALIAANLLSSLLLLIFLSFLFICFALICVSRSAYHQGVPRYHWYNISLRRQFRQYSILSCIYDLPGFRSIISKIQRCQSILCLHIYICSKV